MAKKVIPTTPPSTDDSFLGAALNAREVYKGHNPLDNNPFNDVPDTFSSDSQYDTGLVQGANQNIVRANEQGLRDELGNATLRVGKVIPGILSTVGSLADLENVGGALGIVQTDYKNWLSESMDKVKESIDEAAPIYRENPNKSFDWRDSAYWVENGSDTFNSMMEFGIVGLGLGLGLSGASRLLQANKLLNGIGSSLNKGSQALGALAMNHAEGVITGADVYKQTYDNSNNLKINIYNGEIIPNEIAKLGNGFDYRDLTEDEKVKLAADAASSAVRTNYATAALEYTSLSPIFNKVNKSNSLIDNSLKKGIGESLENQAKRVEKLNWKDLQHGTLSTLAREVPQESIEEGWNVYAQNKGLAKGKVISEEDATLGKSLFSEDGLSSMMWGALGAVGQTGTIRAAGKIKDKIFGETPTDQQVQFDNQKNTIIANNRSKNAVVNRMNDIVAKQQRIAVLENTVVENEEQKEEKEKQLSLLKDDLQSDIMYNNFSKGTGENLHDIVKDYGSKTKEQFLEEDKKRTEIDWKDYQEGVKSLQQNLQNNEKHYNKIQDSYYYMDNNYRKNLYNLKTTKDSLRKQKEKSEIQKLDLTSLLQEQYKDYSNIDDKTLNEVYKSDEERGQNNTKLRDLNTKIDKIDKAIEGLNKQEEEFTSDDFIKKYNKKKEEKKEQKIKDDISSTQKDDSKKSVKETEAKIPATKDLLDKVKEKPIVEPEDKVDEPEGLATGNTANFFKKKEVTQQEIIDFVDIIQNEGIDPESPEQLEFLDKHKNAIEKEIDKRNNIANTVVDANKPVNTQERTTPTKTQEEEFANEKDTTKSEWELASEKGLNGKGRFVLKNTATALGIGSQRDFNQEGNLYIDTDDFIHTNEMLDVLTNSVQSGSLLTVRVDKSQIQNDNGAEFYYVTDTKDRNNKQGIKKPIIKDSDLPFAVYANINGVEVKIGYIRNEESINEDTTAITWVKDGKEVDNLAEQKAEIKRLRNKIASDYTRDIPTILKITSKSAGKLFVTKTTGNLNDKNIQKDVQICVVKSDGFDIGGKKLNENDLINDPEYLQTLKASYTGKTLIVLPTGNGKFMVYPCNSPLLTALPDVTYTMGKVIEAFVRADEHPKYRELLNSLGLDGSETSCQRFINEFIYTTLEDGQKNTLKFVIAQGVRQVFIHHEKVSVDSKKGHSKNQRNIKASTYQSETEENNVFDALKIFAESNYFNVNIHHINNENKEVKLISFDKKEVISQNYRDLLFDTLTTNAQGNEVNTSLGKNIVYFVNPVVQFEELKESNISVPIGNRDNDSPTANTQSSESNNKDKVLHEKLESLSLARKQELEFNQNEYNQKALSALEDGININQAESFEEEQEWKEFGTPFEQSVNQINQRYDKLENDLVKEFEKESNNNKPKTAPVRIKTSVPSQTPITNEDTKPSLSSNTQISFLGVRDAEKGLIPAAKQRDVVKSLSLDFYHFFNLKDKDGKPMFKGLKQIYQELYGNLNDIKDQLEYFSTQEGVDAYYQEYKNDNSLAVGVTDNIERNKQLAEEYNLIINNFEQYKPLLISSLKQKGINIKIKEPITKEKIEADRLNELYEYSKSFGAEGELLFKGIETESGVENTLEYKNKINEINSKYNKQLEDLSKDNSPKEIITEDNIVKDTDSSNDETETDINDEVINESEGLLKEQTFEDGAVFKQNHYSKIGTKIKMLFDSIISTEKTYLDTVSFMDGESIFYEILNILQDKEAGFKFIDKIQAIKEYSKLKNKTYLIDAVKLLEKADGQTQNQFVLTTNLIKQSKILAYTTGQPVTGGDYKATVFEGNRNGYDVLLQEIWKNNNVLGQLYETDIETGDLRKVNQEYIKSVVEPLFNKFKEEQTTESCKEFLDSLGIDISLDILNALKKGLDDKDTLTQSIFKSETNNWEYQVTNKKGLFTKVYNAFLSGKEFTENSSPLENEQYIKKLSRFVARLAPNVGTNSSKNVAGETIYNFTNPNRLVVRLRQLKNNVVTGLANSLKNCVFSANSYFLKEFSNKDSTITQYIKLNPIDGSKDGDKDLGRELKQMTPSEHTRFKLNLFTNGNKEIGNNRIVRILTMAKSDSSTAYDLEFALPKDIFSIVDKGNINPELLTVLEGYVESEYKRYFDAQKYDESQKESIQERFPNYNPKAFYVFPFLNDVKELYTENGELLFDEQRLQIAKDKLLEHLEAVIQDQITEWKKYEIVKNDKPIVDVNYNKNLQGVENPSLKLATEYVVANYIGNFEYLALFAGDPALAGKKDVNTTLDNFFKRLKKDISPYSIGNHKKSTYSSAALEDVKESIDEDTKDNWRKAGVSEEDIEKYEKIDIADGAEFVLLEESLAILYVEGKITDKQYETIIEKLDKDIDLSDAELLLIAKPAKPIQTGSNFVKLAEGIEFENVNLIKTAAFTLVPQLIKGSELEAIHKFMKESGIDRLTMNSGSKLGTRKTIKLSDILDNKKKEQLVATIKSGETREQYINELPREYMGTQQETPYDANKTHILEGSQIAKLILEGLSATGATGATNTKIINSIHSYHNQLMDLRYTKYLEEMGIENGEITDFKKLYDRLISYINDNEKQFSPNDLQYLKLNAEGTGFEINPYLTNQPKKIESLLTSMVTNDVIKQKLPGFSGVLGSSLGMFSLYGQTKTIKNDTIGVNGWKAEDGLKPMRVENGVTKPAQILVSKARFKELFGTVNPTEVDPELLKLIGYRIPTQGYSSMSMIEVVGFLPDYVGDLVIMPKEFVVQMGQDFDIDKLYIHKRNLTTVDGKLQRDDSTSEKYLENRIIDGYLHILGLKEIFPRIIKPVDGGKLTVLAKELKRLLPEKNDYSILSPQQQTQNYFKGILAKSGVGKTSLLSTLNAMFRNNDITLLNAQGERYKRNFRKTYNVSNLSNPLNVKGRNKADVILELQAVVVDHIKELTANVINYNNYTHETFAALALMGEDWDFIGYFLPQEVIKQYCENLDAIQNDTTIKDKEDHALAKTRKEIINKITSKFDADKEPDINSVFANSLEKDENYLKDLLLESNKTDEYWYAQLAILNDYENYRKIGKSLFEIQMGVTAINGIGKDFFESISKEEKANNLNDVDKITNATNLLEKDGNLTPQGNATNILKDVNKIFGKLFPYNEKLMRNLSAQIKKISGKHISPKKKNQIFKFVRSFVYSNDNKLYGEKDITQLRKELLLETKTNKSLVKRWKDYLKDNPSYFFAKRLFANVRFGGNVPSTIRFINVSGGSREDDSQITIELISMLETGNEIEKQLAHDLIVYNFIIGGNQDAYNIIKYLPADYLNYYGFGNAIDIDWNSTRYNDSILRQYFQHSPKEAHQLSANKELTTFEDGEGFIADENENLPKYVAYFDNSKKGKNSYVLFENDGTNRYIRLPLLGYRGFLETNINTGENIHNSIYFKNPVVSNKPMSGKEYMESLKQSEMTEQELKDYRDNLALKAGIDIDVTSSVQKELELETVDSKQVEEKIAECEGDIKVGSSSKFSNFKI